ncbi:hypothetical protein [Leptospira perdikensis]|uniref:Porin n=1 Tax=Leptospira perdikensis TaxID=2484948 RepID=A0A4R9J4R8_9LEPT|nr:hypothetical protein [Leptospira perdikensis]TGL33503.1 hypothetical protein EHQ49_17900 [Leptospira perdikensis]
MKFKILIFLLFAGSVFAESTAQDNSKRKKKETNSSSVSKKEETLEPTPANSDPVVTITQYMANENNFRGISVYGDRYARRNNTEYKSVPDAWFLTTELAFNTGDKKFTSNMLFFNPTVGRTNRDNDYYYQDKPGGENQTQLVIHSLITGTASYDQNRIKKRAERNALGDAALGEFYYNWENRAGSFSTGLYVLINVGDNSRFATSDYTFIWRTPFLKYINPTLSTYYKFTSEFNGYGTGSVYSNLSFSHHFAVTDKFSITPATHIGYQYVNDYELQRRGISDINTSLKISYSGVFIKGIHIYRPDTYLWDNAIFNPQTGVIYSDNNQNDQRVTDPSKRYGLENQFNIDTIKSMPIDADLKQKLIYKYQQQDFIKNTFVIQIGYTMKF